MSNNKKIHERPSWWHSENPSAQLRKGSLGTFFYETLSAGGKIGMIWPFNHHFIGSLVTVSVFMTPSMKARIEDRTKFRFRTPPRISLIQYDETRVDRYEDWRASEDISLKQKGARWFHSDDHHSPSLSKTALGEFLFATLKSGAQVGSVYLLKPEWEKTGKVFFTVYMTEAMKNEIENLTRFRFRDPPGAAFDD
jgi:hypothetical protein